METLTTNEDENGETETGAAEYADLTDELDALSELTALLDEQEEALSSEPEDISDTAQVEPEDDYPAALSVCPEQFKPAENVVCRDCPFAKWHGNNNNLKCWCRDMMSIVYDSDSTEDAITYCDRNRRE